MSRPSLTKVHKTPRVEFAKKCTIMEKKWDNFIFSDEKKFNLDGPDGNQYFWYDLRKEKEIFSKRSFEGGIVLMWDGSAIEDTTLIVFVQTRMNSENYIDILGDNFLPEEPLITSGDYLFQQDIASVHISKTWKSWFDANFVKQLDWPARSPNLNPVWKICGLF